MSGEFEMEGLAESWMKILQYVLENKLWKCE